MKSQSRLGTLDRSESNTGDDTFCEHDLSVVKMCTIQESAAQLPRNRLDLPLNQSSFTAEAAITELDPRRYASSKLEYLEFASLETKVRWSR